MVHAMSERSRNFVFTNFDLTRDEAWYKSFIEKHGVTYICYGDEICPKSKKPHHQGYVVFENPKSKKSVIKKFKPNYVEIADGSTSDNVKYTSKDDKFHEYGIRPMDRGKKRSLGEMMREVSASGEEHVLASADDQELSTWARNYRSIREYQNMRRPHRDFMTRLHIYWGDTLTGKTTAARDEGAIPIEFEGRFWNYNSESQILLDEMTPETVLDRRTMLRLIDRHPYTLNVKGGYVKFVAKDVYITTNFPPHELFPYWTDPAFQRRIHEVKKFTSTQIKSNEAKSKFITLFGEASPDVSGAQVSEPASGSSSERTLSQSKSDKDGVSPHNDG